MPDMCKCPPEAGSAVCELPSVGVERQPRAPGSCPECGQKGKPVQGQTVKALLAVSLRAVQEAEYLFCRTQTCPIVYFTAEDAQTFRVSDVRERVYQKEPDAHSVLICYCFRHTVGEINGADSAARAAIVDDINAGIQAGQCACDLRNPQGSCCLGNVRGLIKRLEEPVTIPA
jgi:hypothetical protein